MDEKSWLVIEMDPTIDPDVVDSWSDDEMKNVRESQLWVTLLDLGFLVVQTFNGTTQIMIRKDWIDEGSSSYVRP